MKIISIISRFMVDNYLHICVILLCFHRHFLFPFCYSIENIAFYRIWAVIVLVRLSRCLEITWSTTNGMHLKLTSCSWNFFLTGVWEFKYISNSCSSLISLGCFSCLIFTVYFNQIYKEVRSNYVYLFDLKYLEQWWRGSLLIVRVQD